MTSSEATSPPDSSAGAADADRIEPLPPALASMWRLCRLGYRHEPGLMVWSFSLALLSALPDALLALWLKLLGDGVLARNATLVRIAVIALGVSATATWFLRIVSTRVQRRFRDKVTIALESHVARLQATVSSIAHHERPEYLDRLAMLRDQVFVLDHMYMSLFSTCGWILRLGVTVALLVSIHPLLALIAVCALPTVLTSSWRPAVERVALEKAEQDARAARHLFTLATTASPAKEVRVTGIGDRLVVERRASWERSYAPVAAARQASAFWHALAWALFGCGYVAGVVFVPRATAPRLVRRCWYWRRAAASPDTLPRRLAKLGSCAGSGWTAHEGSRGSRTTRTPRTKRGICRLRWPSSGAYDSTGYRSRIRAPHGSCSRTCLCCSRRVQ